MTIKYRFITSAGRSNEATVSIQVNAAPPPPPPVAPVAHDDPSYQVAQGGLLQVPAPGVLGNDIYAAGATVEFLPPFAAGLTQSPPFNGAFSLDMSFDPTFTGNITLPYVIHSANGDSNIATASVTVTVETSSGAVSNTHNIDTLSAPFSCTSSQSGNYHGYQYLGRGLSGRLSQVDLQILTPPPTFYGKFAGVEVRESASYLASWQDIQSLGNQVWYTGFGASNGTFISAYDGVVQFNNPEAGSDYDFQPSKHYYLVPLFGTIDGGGICQSSYFYGSLDGTAYPRGAFFGDPYVKDLYFDLRGLSFVGTSEPFFVDQFTRLNGPVLNGWVDMASNTSGDLVVKDDTLSTSAPSGAAGIYRSMDITRSTTVSADLTYLNGAGGLLYRYDTEFLFGSNGVDESGYGLLFYRGDQNFNNSAVVLLLNGVVVEQQASTFQFTDRLTTTFSWSPDGSIVGTVQGGGSSFAFSFGPRSVALPGSNLAIRLGGPDSRTGALVHPTVDNVAILQPAHSSQ